ncbi:MAG: prepilin-type N-terminal cleavage/methylation domain-containing protein [Lachnospiraceae bacterium]|nr:prepilin-type N-terminal cleavage/methylation domain-containing protein [Lachnospiraceae bacterium]
MRKDNRGLSLVEIIIVITILAILAGAVTTGVSLATGRPADECAAKLQSAIQSSRLSAMGKVNVTLEIYMNDKGYIYVAETVETESENPTDPPVVRTTLTRIGDLGVSLEFTLTNGVTTTLQPNHANSLILSFDRSSGAFKPIAGYSDVYCKTITISRGNRVKELELTYVTGKVTLK